MSISNVYDISGCVLDLDFTKLGLSNNANVTSCTDYSANAWHHNVQLSTTFPIYKTGKQNGLSCARFINTSGMGGPAGTGSGLNLNSGYTMVAVCRATFAGGILFGKCEVPTHSNARRKLEMGIFLHSSGDDGVTQSAPYPRPGAGDVFILIHMVNSSGTTLTIRLNGAAVTGVTGSTLQVGSGTNNGTASSIGTAFNGSPTSEFWSGDIYELAIFNSVLGSTDLTDLENFLSTKYGIALTGFHATTFGSDFTVLSNLSNLKHWLDVQQGIDSDLFTAGSGVTDVWPRKDGGGVSWNQPTSGNRPILRAAAGAINKQYLDPDGSDDYMSFSKTDEFNASAYTTFLCMRPPASGSTNIISKGDTGTGGAGRRNTYYSNGGHVRGGDSGTSAAPSGSDIPTVGVWNIYAIRVTNSTTVAYRLGTDSIIRSQISLTPGASFSPTGTNTQPCTLFCTFPGGVEGGSNVDLAGFFHFTVAMTDAEMLAWMQYFAFYYGITWGVDPAPLNKTIGRTAMLRGVSRGHSRGVR